MRIVDLQLSFPAILLALVLSALLGQGKRQLIAALVAAQYAYFARTAYGAASRRAAQGLCRGGAVDARCRRAASSSATSCRTACRR